MLVVVIFLIVRVSAQRTLLESMIMMEFEDDTEEEVAEEAPDPEFERLVASYLEESRSNIPVNVARQVDEELSTERYVDELEEELDAGRSEEYQDLQERLRELHTKKSFTKGTAIMEWLSCVRS